MAERNVRLREGQGLFAAKPEPDQVDGPTDSYEHADQGKHPLVQPLVQTKANATPEDQAR